MIFGNMLCPLSHLPINDGDECVLVPLAYRLNKIPKEQFNLDEAEYPFAFISCPQIVKFNGHPSQYEFLGFTDKDFNGLSNSPSYMFIHRGFFTTLMEKLLPISIYDVFCSQRKDMQFVNAAIENVGVENVGIWMQQIKILSDAFRNMGITPMPCGLPNQGEVVLYFEIIKNIK